MEAFDELMKSVDEVDGAVLTPVVIEDVDVVDRTPAGWGVVLWVKTEPMTDVMDFNRIER